MQKKCTNICVYQKKAVPLHPLSEKLKFRPHNVGAPKILIFGESGGTGCPFI